MRFVLGVLLAAGWLFLSGAVLFAGLLPRWFAANFGKIIRDPKDLPLWAVALEKVAQGVGLALLLRVSPAPVWALLPIPLLLVSTTYLFSTYANYRVPGGPVVVLAALDAGRLAVALVLAAAIVRGGRTFAP